MIWLQEIVQEQFFPTTLLGWLGVLVGYGFTVASGVFAVWRLLMKPIHDRIDAEREERLKGCNGLGARVTEIATGGHTALAKVDLLERAIDRLAGEAAHVHEKVGGAVEAAENTRQLNHETEIKLLNELGAIRERVAATEALIRDRLPREKP